MIKIEHTDVYGWEVAIRGMRNPMNSWDKSDSDWEFVEDPSIINPHDEVKFVLGENDLKLMKSLAKAGTDHSKFLRMINVTVDITAPLYWWKEYDTYKVGTVANSCSTMHKIHDKEFTLEDFSHEKLEMLGYGEECHYMDGNWFLRDIVEHLNRVRDEFLSIKELIKNTADFDEKKILEEDAKKYWWQMIQLLPSSYNQRRTVQLNYQVLKSMYFARRNHKLDEWRNFCAWCETLPYFKEICLGGEKNE